MKWSEKLNIINFFVTFLLQINNENFTLNNFLIGAINCPSFLFTIFSNKLSDFFWPNGEIIFKDITKDKKG